MELKEIVTHAIAEIIQGVLDAQTALGKNGKYINPEVSTAQGPLEKQGRLVSIQGQLVQTVEFDVAVLGKCLFNINGFSRCNCTTLWHCDCSN
jgi:hypothetical protein